MQNKIEDEVKVSVFCTAYNHEKFLAKALDSFVNQKTNFKYEVIVNDDKSTDGTRQIIEDYAKRYPDIIVPIYQTENQFSKGVNIMNEIMFPISKGKYIAICEGDDYWCDENKLQLQYEFMEQHKDCVACFHNSYYYDLLKKQYMHKFNNWKSIHKITAQEALTLGIVHTSSYFIKREHFVSPDFVKKYFFGDYARITTLFTYGDLYSLPQVMSVYNYNNTNGVTYGIYKEKALEKRQKEILTIVEYLNEFNEFSKYKYEKNVLIEQRLINLALMTDLMRYSKNKREFKDNRKKLKQILDGNKKDKLIKFSFSQRIKNFIKLCLPYKIFIKIAGKK